MTESFIGIIAWHWVRINPINIKLRNTYITNYKTSLLSRRNFCYSSLSTYSRVTLCRCSIVLQWVLLINNCIVGDPFSLYINAQSVLHNRRPCRFIFSCSLRMFSGTVVYIGQFNILRLVFEFSFEFDFINLCLKLVI